ncbi:DNA-binding domain-containing protein [Lactobacillus sp. PSON]|uniref:DNA-binding domain-containing protein n=1 Tax=Lactobacillus sp. PSON TaxID=3455454 RepID=UPI0040410D95
MDIISIINALIEREIPYESLCIEDLFRCNKQEKKIILQRVRREIKESLTNLAYMCIDYPEDDIVLEYANNIFGYSNVHTEIQYLHNKTSNHGQVSLRQFFNGIVYQNVK